MRLYSRKTYEVAGYTYGAAVHCPDCTVARFGPEPRGGYTVTDREGNTPKAVFLDMLDGSECCDDCLTAID